MKLEVGQTYKTKTGLKVKITKIDSTGITGTIEQKYTEDGRIPNWMTGHFLDLVLESDETPAKLKHWETIKKDQEFRKEKEKENEDKRELRTDETNNEDGTEGTVRLPLPE